MISRHCIRDLVCSLGVCLLLSGPAAAFQATPAGKNAAAASAVLQSNFVSPDVTVTIQKGLP